MAFSCNQNRIVFLGCSNRLINCLGSISNSVIVARYWWLLAQRDNSFLRPIQPCFPTCWAPLKSSGQQFWSVQSRNWNHHGGKMDELHRISGRWPHAICENRLGTDIRPSEWHYESIVVSFVDCVLCLAGVWCWLNRRRIKIERCKYRTTWLDRL